LLTNSGRGFIRARPKLALPSRLLNSLSGLAGGGSRIRIHGCAESPLFGSGTRRSRRRGSQRPLGRGAIRLQQHLPREPLMVLFQTAKLRRGIQMFRATRSSADDRQITTTLQQVLSSERPINHQRGARCQRQIGAAVKGAQMVTAVSEALERQRAILDGRRLRQALSLPHAAGG